MVLAISISKAKEKTDGNELQVKQIEKIYGNKGSITARLRISASSVGKGEFVGIMGPSGSGKTTPLQLHLNDRYGNQRPHRDRQG